MALHAHDESEARTRKQRVDPMLEAQGWKVVPFQEARPLSKYTQHAVTEYPTESGPADYALVVGGQLLGIVEAKKITLGPQNVLTQAERYAKGVADSPFDFRGYRVPFLYSTNGEVLWFHDIRHRLNTSRRLAAFHTPAALEERPKRTFVVAYPTEDTVSSEWLVREAGVDYKPADYLTAFARFVRENPNKIEAIRILLDRPQDP